MDELELRNAFLETLRNKQSYRNLLYLLLSFPSGIFYFLLLVIGSSVGLSLIVIGVGLLILWLTFGLLQLSGRWERFLANRLLQANLTGIEGSSFSLDGVSKRSSWKMILFLFLKFPLGIMTFSITTSVLSFVLGLITMPFFYQYEFVQVGGRSIDSFWEALAASLFGLILLPVGLMLLNKVAGWWRGLARRLLDVQPASKRKRLSEREAIEAEILRRLIDDGRIDEDSVVEYQAKRKNETVFGD